MIASMFFQIDYSGLEIILLSPCMPPSKRQINGIINAIKEIGLTPEEVDEFTAAERISDHHTHGTRLAYGEIGGCVNSKRFLDCMRKMLESKS